MSKDNNPNSKELVVQKPTIENSLAILDRLDDIEKLATKLKNSEFGKKFAERDNKGNIIEKDGLPIIHTSNIISNIVLGQEMGISPIASIMLGKQLNENSYLCVMRGKSLGLDPITALTKIYPIPTKNGVVISVAVDVISKALIDCGTKVEILEDFAPKYNYFILKQKDKILLEESEVLDSNGEVKADKYFLYFPNSHTAEDIKKAKEEKKEIIIRTEYTKVTTIRFTRKILDVEGKFQTVSHKISYSLQDAIDAKLYPGVTSFGIQVEGKQNWIENKRTMLRNRTLSTGGRIIAADILQGVYTHEEVYSMPNVDEHVLDAEIIEEANNAKS